MKTFATAAIAAAVAASMAAPVLAQTYGQSQYQSQQREYQRSQQEYDRAYADYQAAQAQYQRDRADYDRRYGSGAYDRYYARPPVNARDPYNDPRYNPYDSYRNSPCETRGRTATSGDRAASTIIGALIGGAIGVGVAGDSSETEGAVLGAIVGGAIGNQVGASREPDRYVAKCDTTGYYYTYDQTYPYQESARMRGQRSGRYDNSYYTRQRCRLAVAPSQTGGRTDYRYVRVCPDRNNRYRITG